MQLPLCEFRVPTEIAETFFCRHRRVRSKGSLVDAEICTSCEWHSTPCEDPRPVPDNPFEIASLPVDQSKPFPPVQRQFWNLAVSVTEFVADGFRTVDSQEYESRLRICDQCDCRIEDRCVECGCWLSVKARGRAFKCPLDKWPHLTDE